MYIYTEFVYKPLFNLIIYLQNIAPGHDFAAVIILLSFLVRAAFYPLTKKSTEVQKAVNLLQPEIKKIKEKHKNDKEEQGRKMMELYKKHKVNPMSGCLPILVQLPVMIALYQILRQDIGSQLDLLYPFVRLMGEPNYIFLGIINLTQPHKALALVAGFSQYFSMKIGMPDVQPKSQKEKFSFQNQMKFLSPFLTFFISLQLASGLALFWTTTNIFMIIQQWILERKAKKQATGRVVQ